MASHHSEPLAAAADAPADNSPEVPSPSYQIVTKPVELPIEFLEPSADQKLVIGFGCEGVNLRHNGALCIMQLAFPDVVYLVDAIEGGKELIQACKPALESDHITKVIHDCKRDTEALYFQFGIKLHNVMDTQIAYSLIEEQEGKKRTSDDDSISFVGLRADPRYCGIPYPEKEEINTLLSQDPYFWTIRPLSDMMVQVATDDVRFLLNIHEKMMEKLSKASLWHLALRSQLCSRCFCLNDNQFADGPLLPSVPASKPHNSNQPSKGTQHSNWFAGVLLPLSKLCRILRMLVMHMLNRLPWGLKHTRKDVPPGKMGRVIGRKQSMIMSVKESCNIKIHNGGAKGSPDRIKAKKISEIRTEQATPNMYTIGEMEQLLDDDTLQRKTMKLSDRRAVVDMEYAVLSAKLAELDAQRAKLEAQRAKLDDTVLLQDLKQKYSHPTSRGVSERSRMERLESCGLKNDRNNCFLNVILHCFSYTQPFVSFLGAHKEKCNDKCRCLLCDLHIHIQKARVTMIPFLPVNIFDHLEELGISCSDGQHHDAHEFLMGAIAKMNEDCKTHKFFHEEDTIIDSVFRGLSHSEIICGVCGKSSWTPDPIMSLEVEIQGEKEVYKSLRECLDHYTSTEKLTGDERITCDYCNDQVEGSKRYSILKPPNVLIILLKRFKHLGGTIYKKLDNKVEFLEELDLNPYMIAPGGFNVYELYGVVVHMQFGNEIEKGHYKCYMKSYQGNWTEYDDTEFKNVSLHEVIKQQGYILLYRRKTGEQSAPAAHSSDVLASDSRAAEESAEQGGSISDRACPKLHEESVQQNNLQNRGACMGWKQVPDVRSLGGFNIAPKVIEALLETFDISQDVDPYTMIKMISYQLSLCNPTEGKYPFRIPKGGTKDGDPIAYDPTLKQICKVNKGLYTCTRSDTGRRMWEALQIVKENLTRNLKMMRNVPVSQRGIFYTDPSMFRKSRLSDALVAKMCLMFKCTRRSLMVCVSARGYIIGPVKLHIGAHHQDPIDCSSHVQSVPENSDYIHHIEPTKQVKFILVVEKEGVLKQLRSIQFHEKHNCIIVTGSGVPDLATRALVRKLSDGLGVPVYGFVDGNPYGVRILTVYKFGSESRAFDNLGLTVPNLTWIGVFPQDYDHFAKFGMGVQRLKQSERKMLQTMLNLPWINSIEQWRGTLWRMIHDNVKTNIEAVVDFTSIEGYLSKQIEEIEPEQ